MVETIKFLAQNSPLPLQKEGSCTFYLDLNQYEILMSDKQVFIENKPENILPKIQSHL